MTTRYARLIDGVAVEIWTATDFAETPACVFPPELATSFVPCSSDTEIGAILGADGSWNNPSHPEPTPLIPISIATVTGDEDGFDNGANEWTCKLGATVTMIGPLAVPDQMFRVPCRMLDTGRTIAAVGEVVGGQLTITLTLPELGYWQTTEELINSGFQQAVFALPQPIRIVVI